MNFRLHKHRLTESRVLIKPACELNRQGVSP
jgi:hypothetical protein